MSSGTQSAYLAWALHREPCLPGDRRREGPECLPAGGAPSHTSPDCCLLFQYQQSTTVCHVKAALSVACKGDRQCRSLDGPQGTRAVPSALRIMSQQLAGSTKLCSRLALSPGQPPSGLNYSPWTGSTPRMVMTRVTGMVVSEIAPSLTQGGEGRNRLAEGHCPLGSWR